MSVDAGDNTLMIYDGRTRRRLVGDLGAVGLAGPQALRAFAQDGTLPTPISPIRKRLSNPFVETGKPIVAAIGRMAERVENLIGAASRRLE